MSEQVHIHKSHTVEYVIVFFALSLLTGLELAIPGLNVEYYLKAISLVGLAFGKAFIVAYFYMHLKEEKGWLKFIAALPVLAVMFAVILILESMYR
jgi:caa(3)-type oxidase subunit IV